MALSTTLKDRIESLIASDAVVLFIKGTRESPQCGFSSTVVQIFDQLVPKYSTFNVLEDMDLREGIKEYASWPTIPQVYVRGEFIGGCDILKELSGSGEIYEVLKLTRPNNKVPNIAVADLALSALQAVKDDAGDGEILRLDIDARFNHGLTLDSVQKDDIEIKLDNVSIYCSPLSAMRAEGLKLDFIKDGIHEGFDIKNPNAPTVKNMSVGELKAKLDNKEDLKLFDVRTKEEWLKSHIDAATLLETVPEEDVKKLDKNQTIVFHCHFGGRSKRMSQKFVDMGFSNVYNLVGGIDAWSKEVDSSVPIY